MPKLSLTKLERYLYAAADILRPRMDAAGIETIEDWCNHEFMEIYFPGETFRALKEKQSTKRVSP